MRKLVRPFIGLVVIALPLPLGGNRSWILLAFLTAVLLAGGLMALANVPQGRFPRRARELGILLAIAGAWLAFVVLQAAGGINLLAGLSPPDALDAAELARVLDDTPQFFPISLFPDATLHEIACGLLCFGVFTLTACALRIPRHAFWMLGFVVASAALQGAIGAFEYFMRLDFPAMTPLSDHPINGTFVNRNHFAGFITAGAGVLIGLLAHEMFGRDDTDGRVARRLAMRILDLFSARLVALLGALLLMITVIGASGSRGAFLGLVVAILGGFGALALYAPGQGRRTAVFGIVAVALLGAALLNSTVFERSLRLFERGLEDGRLSEWSISLDTIASRPLTGFGAGAFTDAYALHRDGRLGRNQTFDHAHNQYLEILVENGIIGAALLAAFVLLVMRMAVRSPNLAPDPGVGAASTAALFGMLALLGHALVEFTFEIPAIMVTFFVLAGIAAAVFTWMGPARFRVSEDSESITVDAAS